ncbi:MAG: tRNA uridine(34) 5-carboxymethylaminomethyl modification radical SAM/GNAT enzyme Elp3, partial [Myxococcota bacterium]
MSTARALFEPRAHEASLVAVLRALAAAPSWNAHALDALLRRHPRAGSGLFSRSELLAGLEAFSNELALGGRRGELAEFLRRRRIRTLSGVAPVAVFTKPHPCPGRCIFCPTDLRMPKSYLSAEPGCQRAAQYAFDPFEQTSGRLRDYRAIGHPIDKVELIVLGGTWSAYPLAYRIWFVKRCLDALNRFDDRSEAPDVSERAGWSELEAAQSANERAELRCVGLSLETRPDHVSRAGVIELRRLGATRIQLGLQSLSDDVLARNERGHGVAESRAAIALLRSAGFKLHAHWMPNLLGSSPDADRADYERLFGDPALRPDELKIYPCFLIDGTELVEHWRSGAWRPYDDEELVSLLADCMASTPRWCRLTRIVRDISAQDIVAGSKVANLRERAEARLRASCRASVDIRAREIRGETPEPGDFVLRETAYEAAGGRELFIEAVTASDRLLGFARLRLPSEPAWLDELRDSALLRELHVYGALAPLGVHAARHAQHRGVGQRLLGRAAEFARDARFERLAVISAVGTRPYYERHGFERGQLYQSLRLVHWTASRAGGGARSEAQPSEGRVG